MPESHVKDQPDRGGTEEYEGHYRSLLAAMKDGFSLNEVICDSAGLPYDFRILDVNPAFERLFNLKKEMLVGRTYRQLAGKADPILIERARSPPRVYLYCPGSMRSLGNRSFPSHAIGAAMPYGIYDHKRNDGVVNIG